MRTGSASGIQIAFLVFAVALLSVPLSLYVTAILGTTVPESDAIGRTIPFVVAAVVIAVFPPLRKQVSAELSRPILPDRRLEVAIVGLAKIPMLLGTFGAIALWTWMSQGGYALDRKMAYSAADELAKAFSPEVIWVQLVLAVAIAPVIEEVVFRGLLYRTWERRWGAMPSALMVSALFGLYHPIFLSAFASSLLCICILRRVGSLWGPILVHGFSNAMTWYPFVGQFAKPPSTAALGDINTWGLQLGCLLLASVALPFYFMLGAREDVRDRQETGIGAPLAPTIWLER